MAVPTVDAVSSGQIDNSQTITISHTCSGDNRVLVAVFCVEDVANAADLPCTGVTYNGVAMTEVRQDEFLGTENGRSGIFMMYAPDTGTHNLVFTFTGSVEGIGAGGVSFNHAKQTNTPNAHNGAVGTAQTTATVSVTTTVNDCIVLDIVYGQSSGTPLTVGNGQTQQFIETNSGNLTANCSTRPMVLQGTATMNWTMASNNYTSSAVAIAPLNSLHVFGDSSFIS